MQRAELALRLKEVVAAEAKKRQARKPKSVVQKSAQQNSGKTRDELAKIAGVSHDTISKVEKIVTEAKPEVVEAARKGEMSINAAFQTVAPKAAPKPAPPPSVVEAVEKPAPIQTDEPQPPQASPVRRMKNWERFKNRIEADAAHAAEKIIFGCGWGEIEWLYMDYIPDEPRLDYLRRLEKRHILKNEGYKEIKRLEKAAKELKK